MDAAALKSARREVRSQQNAINRRRKAVDIDAHTDRGGRNLTEDEKRSIDQMASTLELIAANAAEKALSEKVGNQSLALERRWGYLLAAHRTTDIARNSVPDSSSWRSKEKQYWDINPPGTRLLDQILLIATEKTKEPTRARRAQDAATSPPTTGGRRTTSGA